MPLTVSGKQSNALTLLKPKNLPPRQPLLVLARPTMQDLKDLLPAKEGGLWAIDLETVGTDASDPGSYITGIGMAGRRGCFYLDVRGLDYACTDYLHARLREVSLVAHNVMFDAAHLQRWLGEWPNFVACTFGLYKQIATEGYTGQTWGLKRAQTELLLWPESNEANVYEWLAANGMAKSQMGLVPAEILGPYSALDAESCWLLYSLFEPVLEKFPELDSYHRNEFITLVRLLVEQQHRGFRVDVDKLRTYATKLEIEIWAKHREFLGHKDVAPFTEAYRLAAHKAYLEGTPKGKLPLESDRFGFNANSKIQLGWLFYECQGHTPMKWTPTKRPVVDKKVLPYLGESGRLLYDYNKMTKELSYVQACLDHTRNGVLHPIFKAPGTLTGRLAGGGGFNMQQQPKTKGYLECITARPGYKLVQLDFSAIEPVVLTEFSGDENLMKIYGPGALPQDVYLFTASKIPALGKEIIKYYNPDAPTAEGIALAKKHCKKDREVAKTVQLAKTYNAYPPKIHETLTRGGINISLNEVATVCAEFDALYKGVARFKAGLETEWRNRGGYILSGIGRPLTVARKLTKDLVNRFCQSTGHDLLMMYIIRIDSLKKERGLQMWPVQLDEHDATTWECREQDALAVQQLFIDALARLNEFIGGRIPIKGSAMIVDNFAEIKCE